MSATAARKHWERTSTNHHEPHEPRTTNKLEMSKRAEENEFMDSFGKQYGYAGQIDEIRTQEFKRLEGN